MFQRFSQVCLWLAAVVAVFAATSMLATAQMGNDKMSSDQAVTGCLQKGVESGGYFLLTPEGKHWELYPSSDVSLADHVGHTVTVSGSMVTRTPAQEKKSQSSEKKEIAGQEHGDWQVTSVKMVGETCSK